MRVCWCVLGRVGARMAVSVCVRWMRVVRRGACVARTLMCARALIVFGCRRLLLSGVPPAVGRRRRPSPRRPTLRRPSAARPVPPRHPPQHPRSGGRPAAAASPSTAAADPDPPPVRHLAVGWWPRLGTTAPAVPVDGLTSLSYEPGGSWARGRGLESAPREPSTYVVHCRGFLYTSL